MQPIICPVTHMHMCAIKESHETTNDLTHDCQLLLAYPHLDVDKSCWLPGWPCHDVASGSFCLISRFNYSG